MSNKMNKESIEQYIEIAKRIINQIALLKNEYPHFSEIEPIEEKIYVSTDPFEVRFLYSHHMDLIDNPRWKPLMKIPRKILAPTSEDGIYIGIRFIEKGKYMGQRVVFPVYIGNMYVIVDILGDSPEIRGKIWRIIVSEEVDYLVEEEAWYELKGLGDAAVEALVQDLKDKDKDVRAKAAKALRKIRGC